MMESMAVTACLKQYFSGEEMRVFNACSLYFPP